MCPEYQCPAKKAVKAAGKSACYVKPPLSVAEINEFIHHSVKKWVLENFKTNGTPPYFLYFLNSWKCPKMGQKIVFRIFDDFLNTHYYIF